MATKLQYNKQGLKNSNVDNLAKESLHGQTNQDIPIATNVAYLEKKTSLWLNHGI
jgi:hypothetical protein